MTVCPYCNPELQPQEEDSKTTLFSGDAYPQPQEEDSKTTLFSGDAYPQPQEEDNKTTLFSGDAYPQPQDQPYMPGAYQYPSAPQANQPYQQPYQQPYNNSPIGQPIATSTPQNSPYSYPAAPPAPSPDYIAPPVQNEPEKKKSPHKRLAVDGCKIKCYNRFHRRGKNLIFLSFSPSVYLRYAFYRSNSQR